MVIRMATSIALASTAFTGIKYSNDKDNDYLHIGSIFSECRLLVSSTLHSGSIHGL
jgi:hypothetical protein